ncbi:YccF domain-containing protein [Clostridium sardiniense]|uniref:YccF domain-containing protein n=1 Tax=Clostridium sardiniense TaxID=29369 RepID=A0ABS7KZW0_CLOSR|nr:YccF domain-containing protein [Clostridium sardiniense]MBY0756344.1 YccF domain-containing protein [Clostridium sardiniense]
MSCLGNIIWIIFGGLFNALGWLFLGVVWCITIIGIPVGLQCFKMAKLQFAPFGKEIVTVNDGGTSLILNILWIIFGGLAMCISNLISAALLCITIIGIPFAVQSIKIAKLSLMPFGKDVV